MPRVSEPIKGEDAPPPTVQDCDRQLRILVGRLKVPGPHIKIRRLIDDWLELRHRAKNEGRLR